MFYFVFWFSCHYDSTPSHVVLRTFIEDQVSRELGHFPLQARCPTWFPSLGNSGLHARQGQIRKVSSWHVSSYKMSDKQGGRLKSNYSDGLYQLTQIIFKWLNILKNARHRAWRIFRRLQLLLESPGEDLATASGFANPRQRFVLVVCVIGQSVEGFHLINVARNANKTRAFLISHCLWLRFLWQNESQHWFFNWFLKFIACPVSLPFFFSLLSSYRFVTTAKSFIAPLRDKVHIDQR